jgi:hypothetical protein
MHLQGIKEERERSARKLSEIEISVNINRELVYEFIKGRTDTLASECMTGLDMGGKLKKYLEWLVANGHLVRKLRTINGRRQYQYNVSHIPYVRPSGQQVIERTPEQLTVESVTRVYKLLDRKQPPRHKSEQPKRKVSVNIGSSMSLFNNF